MPARRHRFLTGLFALLWLSALSPVAVGEHIFYTLEQTEQHLRQIAPSPWVRPTPSARGFNHGGLGADGAGDLGRFIIGRTPGTEGGGYTWGPDELPVPAQSIYAFHLSDFETEGDKVRVIIVGGQHADEQHSLHALEGMVDFLLGDDPRAAALRRRAEFFIYPQVNPEGNWAPGAGKSSGIAQQPEQPRLDMNRFWHEPDTAHAPWDRPFANIQIVRGAMKVDTAPADAAGEGAAEKAGDDGEAGEVGYLFDFHTPGPTRRGQPFIYVTRRDRDSAFGRAVLEDGTFTLRTSAGHRGMLRIWSKTPAEGCGLGVQHGFTPEITRQDDDEPDTYRALGATLAHALHAALVEQMGEGE